MTEINQKIIDMILNNATANEICNITGLSNKQLFYRLNMLKTKGYNFLKKYYYDGEIGYQLQKDIYTKDGITLLTSPNDIYFKAVFISDLHLANKKDRVDLLEQVYNFCINNGIHIILNCGDIIDGFLGKSREKRFDTFDEQINYMLKVYPYDKNILNFICLGNHDLDALRKSGQNLETIFLTKRHDIVPLGYGIGELNIKNDKIVLYHPNTIDKKIDGEKSFTIVGHSHKSSTSIQANCLKIQLSSLSNLKRFNENKEPFTLPGFITASIKFKNGFFYSGIFEQYTFFAKRMYKVNESFFELARNKNIRTNIIKNEECRIPYNNDLLIEEEKVLKKTK